MSSILFQLMQECVGWDGANVNGISRVEVAQKKETRVHSPCRTTRQTTKRKFHVNMRIPMQTRGYSCDVRILIENASSE